MSNFSVDGEIIMYDGRNTGMKIVNTLNCKYSIFEYISYLNTYCEKYNLNFKDVLIFILKYANITVQFHTDKVTAQLLIDNFDYYYHIAVPIGYTGTDTHFILLKNPYSLYSDKAYLREKPPVINV